MQAADTGSIQVLSRAMAVLKACEQLGPGLSLGDIARHIDLPRSTVQRIVQSLIDGGFLISGGRSKSIALGPDLLAMGADATVNVFEIAHPYLKELSEQTGETVDLARLSRDHMVFINQLPGAHRLRAVSAVGDTFPLHCTANGKAALAKLSEQRLHKLLASKLAAFTHNTITDHARLLREIKSIRQSAIATDNEEHTLGIAAIGAAFLDRAHQIYAISIPIPTVRFKPVRAKCEPLLLSTVKAISAAIIAR
ncbi:IclR family transcriptional regulator [Aestuariivirga litoralis]|uniref:IclR family transcriptional regulator n=1 Tax=Aestuariivirga litoralis TaxID=2650924 RepID=UPI0018C5F2C7|nr:IclR family transcriptional regulator [Aestuariivirga litoralis]MBG1233272.1 IclR family transcriptional regulator [Aestuariivirga litoralis]